MYTNWTLEKNLDWNPPTKSIVCNALFLSYQSSLDLIHLHHLRVLVTARGSPFCHPSDTPCQVLFAKHAHFVVGPFVIILENVMGTMTMLFGSFMTYLQEGSISICRLISRGQSNILLVPQNTVINLNNAMLTTLISSQCSIELKDSVTAIKIEVLSTQLEGSSLYWEGYLHVLWKGPLVLPWLVSIVCLQVQETHCHLHLAAEKDIKKRRRRKKKKPHELLTKHLSCIVNGECTLSCEINPYSCNYVKFSSCSKLYLNGTSIIPWVYNPHHIEPERHTRCSVR